jgi:hypothetical protein
MRFLGRRSIDGMIMDGDGGLHSWRKGHGGGCVGESRQAKDNANLGDTRVRMTRATVSPGLPGPSWVPGGSDLQHAVREIFCIVSTALLAFFYMGSPPSLHRRVG